MNGTAKVKTFFVIAKFIAKVGKKGHICTSIQDY
jgi:hypothetical protein